MRRRRFTIRTRFGPAKGARKLGHRTMINTTPRIAAHTGVCAANAAGETPVRATSNTGTSSGRGTRSLERLAWNNRFAETLPADPDTTNRTRQVEGAIFTRVNPSPTGTEPTFIIGSSAVADMIDLDPAEFSRPEFAMIFSGNARAPGSDPYAQCYGGHQFGHWAGQLGDGRALSLGEVEGAPVDGAADGKDASGVGASTDPSFRWELQLKGAGRTPYSRNADGRAVLRSSLREYVASEAMAALGVPTTRALCLVRTGAEVMRDMFYNGNAQLEPGAVACRVARSFVRFGSFQLPASRGDFELVRTLADYIMKEYYGYEESDAKEGRGAGEYASWFRAVAQRTGVMVAEWQRVGFTHGVCNSDNFSILGDTIDYGPYGWMERFDPTFTPNTTDLPGRRYCYQAQPEIGQWNLLQLARALVGAGLLDEEAASDGIAAYGEALVTRYTDNTRRKMGLKVEDGELANKLLMLMYESSADYTNTFRTLGGISLADMELAVEVKEVPSRLRKWFGDGFEEEKDDKEMAWIEFFRQFTAELKKQGVSDVERWEIQREANPVLVPRNHVMVGIIGEVERGDLSGLKAYMKALENPYGCDKDVDASWLEPAPSKPRLGVELLSCSS